MLTGRKLLLADDSLTIQKVVSLTFNDEAMEVVTAASGAEALEKLQESLPDIVLADVFMPEPNGYELCERIKSDERTRHLPVVLLVGTFEPFNEAEARRVGADEVLTKPFQSIRDLVNKVGGLLGGSDEKTADAAEAARDQQSAEETTQDLSPFAPDARAANPHIETHAAGSTSPAASTFNDFDMDDATIQSTPAAAFDARAEHTASDILEINEEEQFSDRGETEEAFVLSDDESPAQAHAATATAVAASGNSYAPSSNAATEAAPVASASTFSAHAARAAEADDALLELGDIAPAHGGAATAEADDFILDIGDDDAFDAVAVAPTEYAARGEYAAPTSDASVAEIDMLFAENAPLPEVPEAFTQPAAFTEPEAFTETRASAETQKLTEPEASEEIDLWASPAAETERWESPAATVTEAEPAPLAIDTDELEAPEISESPALLFANEPATDAHATESFAEQESESQSRHAPAWDGEPVAASIVAHAGGVAPVESPVESRPAELFADETGLAGVAAGASSAAASSESSQSANAAAPSLSPDMLDELVRRVVAHMSERVVREIAWEVVPDLAERLIKQRLEEEKTRTQ